MKKIFTYPVAVSTGLLLTGSGAQAHCPLCTAGAGAMAGAAALAGVKYGAIGIFIGAFAAALGLWAAKMIKKQYFRQQQWLIFAVVYLSTILPLIPFTKDYSSIFISMSGDYGSLLNRTYLINWFIIGAVLGAVIVFVTPYLSSFSSRLFDGKKIKFQGLIMTLLLLIIAGLLMQFLR